jgi:hypothetical protein
VTVAVFTDRSERLLDQSESNACLVKNTVIVHVDFKLPVIQTYQALAVLQLEGNRWLPDFDSGLCV